MSEGRFNSDVNPSTLSVCMIVRDEEDCIERALRSAAWADEIIIVDSGSADNTVEICRRFTKHVYKRSFDNYAAQKNAAVQKASGDWILSLDADEEVTPALKDHVLSLLSKAGYFDAYRIKRRSQIFGRFFKYSGTQDDAPIRLFRRGKGSFEGSIHETVRLRGSDARLAGEIIHYTYKDLKDYWERLNRYTSLESQRFCGAGAKIPGFFELFFKPFLMFGRLYILKQGFRDGLEGFLFCALSSYYVFLKHAKHAERIGNGSGSV